MIKMTNHHNPEEVSDMLNLPYITADMFKMLCGEKLGAGTFRAVYEFGFNPRNQVIKIEADDTDSNMSEYMLWKEAQWLRGDLAWVKNWLAPVHWVSPDYKILVMSRTYPRPKKERPDVVPDFFTDIKFDNFGWIGDRLVCHDYGFISKFIQFNNKKLQKVIW